MRHFCFYLIIMIFASPVVAAEKETVIMLHGIARSASHMKPLARYLERHGYEVANLDYASTDYALETLMKQTWKEVTARDHGQKIHFVGYSMGGLVIRGMLHQQKPKNMGRVVMLGTPNQGSEVADFFKKNKLYKKIYGPAGAELTTKNIAIKKLFGPIDYELGIIAGNNTIDPISSMIIPGDDDGKVSINSTKLDGMKDHIIIGTSHTFFPSNKKARKLVRLFLQQGRFR